MEIFESDMGTLYKVNGDEILVGNIKDGLSLFWVPSVHTTESALVCLATGRWWRI